METVQIAISDAAYARALKELLVRNGSWEVLCVDSPDLSREGVMVLDSEHLERLPRAMQAAERVVLISSSDPHDLARAWEAGVSSVVFDKDPLNTALLAILAIRLQTTRPHRSDAVYGLPEESKRGLIMRKEIES